MDQQNKLDQLAAIVRHPWRLLKAGGQLGLKVIKTLLVTFILFATVNIVAIIIALIKLPGALQQNWLHFLGVIAVALISMTIATIIIYRNIKLQLSLTVYTLSVDYLQKLSDMIVTKIKQATPTAAVDKVVDLNRMVRDAYSLVPAPLRSLVEFFIRQVPMVGIISASKAVILKEPQQKASSFLFNSLNTSIREALERKIGPWQTWLVLSITLLLQFLVIFRMA